MNPLLGKLLRVMRAGDRHLAWYRLGNTPHTIRVSSPAFADGGKMPLHYAGHGVGDNVSPPLHFADVPGDAGELVLIVQDPDAPTLRPVVHLIARLGPDRTELPEGALRSDAPVRFGKGSFGRLGYTGPRPPAGHGRHRYIFQVFAMPHRLQLPPDADLKAHLKAMRGLVLARGRMTGTFQQK